jgi:hypothetical protein
MNAVASVLEAKEVIAFLQAQPFLSSVHFSFRFDANSSGRGSSRRDRITPGVVDSI